MKLSEMMDKSISDGKIVVFSKNGNAITKNFFGIWHCDNSEYKVLLKSFNSSKETVMKNLLKLKETNPDELFGLLQANMDNGQWLFILA